MSGSKTYYLSSRIVERAQPMLDCGRFDSVSELCRHAVRCFQEWLDSDGEHEIAHVRRTRDYKRSLPLNQWVLDRIMEHDVVSEAEVVDYALDYYLKRNGL